MDNYMFKVVKGVVNALKSPLQESEENRQRPILFSFVKFLLKNTYNYFYTLSKKCLLRVMRGAVFMTEQCMRKYS